MQAHRATADCLATCLACSLFFASTGVAAQGSDPSWTGFYAGGGGSYSTVSVERSGEGCNDYAYYNYVCPGYDEGDGDYGYSLHAGYRLHRYVALEASYLETGTIRWHKNLVYVPELNGFYNTRADFSAQMTGLTLLGIWPFAGRWEIYLRLGAGFWDGDSDQRLDDSFGDEVIAYATQDEGTDFLIGLGLGVTLARAWHLRFDFQSLTIDGDMLATRSDASLDSMLLEVQYRFGARQAPPPPAAAPAAMP
jgi:hypothetical protein